MTLITSGCCEGRMPIGGADMCMVDQDPGEDSDTGIVWGEGDCCEQYGALFGGICEGVSDIDGSPEDATTGNTEQAPTCYGCDWEPVLCMTHGCGTKDVQDCCLNEVGETVVCEPG